MSSSTLITGIIPYVAQTMVSIGVDLVAIKTCANLRDGLRYCVAKGSRR